MDTISNPQQALFEEVYKEYISPIYRFVLFRVHTKEDAEDITQSVFTKAFARNDLFSNKDHMVHSLYAIARTTIIDHWRKRHRTDIFGLDLDAYQSHQPSPIQITEINESVSTLQKLLSHLSDDESEIVIMRYLNGVDNAIIAKTFNKTEMAIRQIQSRALRKLRDTNQSPYE